MAKTRVYELARDLGVESKEVLERAVDLGIDVKTASSGLDEESAGLLRLAFEETTSDAEQAAEPGAAEPETSPAPEPAAATPQPEPAAEQPEPAAEQPEPATEQPEPATEPAATTPAPAVEEAPAGPIPLQVQEGLTVKEFADLMNRGVGGVVKALMELGELAAANAPVPLGAIEPLAAQFGYEATVTAAPEVVEEAPAQPVRPTYEDDEADLRPRPPVVTVMGHVDHGKTKLLDVIRSANVVAGEAGGITQHIGAYQVDRGDDRRITFIDTPGHEAFTALRARGANVTDIVVLVVAADDGVMPQTAEAISHARAAGVPMIVAINKIDLDAADPYAVRAQLTEHEVVVEELGGEVVSVEVSALENLGIDDLLEAIDLVAELEELRANPEAAGSGVVIEAQLDKGRGAVATVIVLRGTLRVGDSLVAGHVSGRVRAMFDENGKQVKEAGPSTPVLMMGWAEVPTAGDFFEVVEDDKTARSAAQDRLDEMRSEELVVPSAQERLTQLLEQLRAADVTELRVIVKADAHGSLEAIRDAIRKIGREDAKVEIIHAAVGGITENDIVLAEASEGVVFGFNVRPDGPARRAAEQKGVEVRTYRIIYELLEDVEAMLVGQLAPEELEVLLGAAEVRATFRAPRYGMVAGCYVTEGEMVRNARVRLVRDGVVVYDGRIGSLRRFKEDVPRVATGFECGIGLENFRDVKEGDVLESYEVREVART